MGRAVFKVVRSLRDTMTSLVLKILSWCYAHVMWNEDPVNYAEELEWFLLLGLPLACAESCAQMGLHFLAGRLLVSVSFRGTVGFYDLLNGNILTIYHFRTFSMSRWAGSGGPARTLLACDWVGMPSLVEEMRSDPDFVGEWYLSGFECFTQKCRFVA